MSNYSFKNLSNDKLLNFYKILIFSFPFCIVSGNLIPNGIVILSLPLIVYIFFFKKKFIYFSTKEIKFIFFVFLYLIISSLISMNSYSIEFSIRFFRFFTFILIIYYFFLIDEKFEKKFFKLFNFLFFILLIDGFYQYFNGSNILGIEKKVEHRISGLFGSELVLGSFISKYIFIFFKYFFTIKKMNELFILIYLISLIILTYVTGERVAFFSIMLFSILALFKFFNYKRLLIFFLFLFSILLTISFKDPITKERMISETIKQTKFLKEWKNPKKILIYSDDHNAHFQSAYLMFKKGDIKDKLFGRGFKSFRINCSEKNFVIPLVVVARLTHIIYFFK